MPGDEQDGALPEREGEGGLQDALAKAQAAESAWVAGQAARVLGCGDACMEAAERVIRAGLLRLGGAHAGRSPVRRSGPRGPGSPVWKRRRGLFAATGTSRSDTVLGLVPVTWAWCRCAECGRGLAPRDAELGVTGTSMSPGLAAMNDLAASAGPFAGAARLLEEIGGVCPDRQARPAGRRGQRHRRRGGRARARPAAAAPELVPLLPSPLPDSPTPPSTAPASP